MTSSSVDHTWDVSCLWILRPGDWHAASGRRVREEALDVIARLEAAGPRFGDGWERWLPDPAWPRPELLLGWDDPTR